MVGVRWSPLERSSSKSKSTLCKPSAPRQKGQERRPGSKILRTAFTALTRLHHTYPIQLSSALLDWGSFARAIASVIGVAAGDCCQSGLKWPTGQSTRACRVRESLMAPLAKNLKAALRHDGLVALPETQRGSRKAWKGMEGMKALACGVFLHANGAVPLILSEPRIAIRSMHPMPWELLWPSSLAPPELQLSAWESFRQYNNLDMAASLPTFFDASKKLCKAASTSCNESKACQVCRLSRAERCQQLSRPIRCGTGGDRHPEHGHLPHPGAGSNACHITAF